MKRLPVARCAISVALIGVLAGAAVQAAPQADKTGPAQAQAGPQTGTGYQGGGWYGHHSGPGRHHGHGMHHGGYGRDYGEDHRGKGKRWMASLSPEQRQQVMQLRAAYKKQSMPRKARMRAIRLEFAALSTADKQDSAAIEAKIDELLWLKKEAMLARAKHVAEVRKLLNEEQKAAYDMAVMRKASGGHRRHH